MPGWCEKHDGLPAELPLLLHQTQLVLDPVDHPGPGREVEGHTEDQEDRKDQGERPSK